MSCNNKNLERLLPTGYYVIGCQCLKDKNNKKYKEANLKDFEDGENSYESADVFLRGSCHLFALELQRKYGYAALNLQTEGNKHAHYFCKANFKGVDVYIDVRGITMNLKEVISGFTSGEYKIIPYDFANEKVLSKADEYGMEFARQIINDTPDWYDINKI